MDAPRGFTMSHTGACLTNQKEETSMTKVTTVGLDLAKSVFQVHGADQDGRPVVRKKLRRAQVIPFFAALGPCLIGMEVYAAVTN
jgi:hypothetical protein